MNWSQACSDLQQRGEAYVLVTVIGVRGSTPRNSGTKMVVTATQLFGTIGGGHLEYKALAKAQALIAGNNSDQHIEHFALGPSLGQCCGGSATLMFECFARSGIDIAVFGAGHIGKVLVPILAGLNGRVHWIDNRENEFPDSVAAEVNAIISDHPVDEVDDLPAGCYYLILTHNHQLDFDLTSAVINRGDAAYLGVIGSNTKALRFQKRLQQRGFSQQQIDSMTCPMGNLDVPGKLPTEVAVSVSAEIISHYHQHIPAQPTQQGMSWRNIKTLLNVEQGQSINLVDTGPNHASSSDRFISEHLTNPVTRYDTNSEATSDKHE
jgi:xanthine dehydrogenase accessory factor